MKSNDKKLETIQVRLDKKLKEEYFEFCKKNGYDISKRIRLFIINEINEKEKNK